MFAKASSSVAPCDQHPGRPGQETLYPSSVRIKTTGYFIPPTLACPSERHCTDTVTPFWLMLPPIDTVIDRNERGEKDNWPKTLSRKIPFQLTASAIIAPIEAELKRSLM